MAAFESSAVRYSDAVKEVASGGAAGVAAWASIYPIEVIKSRMQAQSASFAAVRTQLAREGGGAAWRGCGATLLRAFVVNGAIFYGVGAARRALTADS